MAQLTSRKPTQDRFGGVCPSARSSYRVHRATRMSSRWLQLRLPKVSAIWRVNRERRSGRLSTTGGVSCRERRILHSGLGQCKAVGSGNCVAGAPQLPYKEHKVALLNHA